MAGVTALRRRLPVLAGAVSAALAVVLAVAAVLLAVQTAPTASAAQAREHVGRLVLDAASAAGLAMTTTPVAADGAACPWLGVEGWPASHQVRPRVELRLALRMDPGAVLDAVARVGNPVGRGASGVEVRDGGGYRLTVLVAETDEVVLVGESPCVWPSGTREPVG